MTRRMFLAVPSDPLVPEGPGITYLPDGLMVDLTADIRCATCKWWRYGGDEYGVMLCYMGKNSSDENFGCIAWEQRPSE